jgi:hypothetical protein
MMKHSADSANLLHEADHQRYSDLAITTVLVIKRVFRLTLRAAQGLLIPFFSDERSAALPGLHLCQQAGKVG